MSTLPNGHFAGACVTVDSITKLKFYYSLVDDISVGVKMICYKYISAFMAGWRIRKKYFLMKIKNQPKERLVLSWVSWFFASVSFQGL